MKFVAVFALMLVAVSASYYFKQPKFPCAYQIKIKLYEDKKEVGKYSVEMNGRYAMASFEFKDEGYDDTYLVRPDIGGKDNATLILGDKDNCYVYTIEMEEANYFTHNIGNLVLMYVDGRNWEKKKSEEWRGKKCDHYYDDDDDDESIYIYDDRIYGMVDRRYEYVFEYKWEAPMEDFVMKEKDFPQCAKQEQKITEVPSEDYIMCAASSLKVAFAAILVALLAALF